MADVQRYTMRMHSRDAYFGNLDEFLRRPIFYCDWCDPNPLGGQGYLRSEYDDAFWYAGITGVVPAVWSSRMLINNG